MKKTSRALKSKKGENVIVEKDSYLGLCSYCKSSPKCTFTRDPSRPVYQCEEFGESTYSPVRIPNQKNFSLKNWSKNSLTRGDSPHQGGLCPDCEGRATCLYPKPEGGVWHCEEFR